MKMYDVGHRVGESVTLPKCDKKTKSYPSLFINTKEFPSLKGKEIGEKLIILMECEIMSLDIRQNENEEKREEYRLEIKKMGEESKMKMEKALEKALEE